MYCVMAIWTEEDSRTELDFMTEVTSRLGVHWYVEVTSETDMTFGN